MMSSDYKWDIQVIAERLADERYQSDFYDLNEARQQEVYTEAMSLWSDALADHADYMRKAERETNGKRQ
jgi:hypothetical protein